MASKPLPSPEVLRQLLRYEPETGKLFWLHRAEHFFEGHERSASWLCAWWNKRFAGKEAFTADTGAGYRGGALFGQQLKAHRVIWALVTGEWPPKGTDIDHANGSRADNRFENLRLASRQENTLNRGATRANKCGLKGVSWYKAGRKWRAEIKSPSGREYLGQFDTPEEAHAAYCAAAERLHGQFVRTA